VKYLIPILFIFNSHACDPTGKTGILPENDLTISTESLTGISEKDFNEVLDRIQEIYEPIIASKDKVFKIKRDWKNPKVNAAAIQNAKSWWIYMYGGLARHETITKDGFALVACHEVGHHLAGAPKKGAFYEPTSWASNEGQSDYFGTTKCLRKYFQLESNPKKAIVDPYATRNCQKRFSSPREITICERSAMAGLSLANLFKAMRGNTIPVRFDTPDPKTVSSTYDKHPDPQCRLDTYFNGSICDKDFNADFSDIFPDDFQAACTQQEGYTLGMRPRCWYKPDRS
jgi:hypothetical protein